MTTNKKTIVLQNQVEQISLLAEYIDTIADQTGIDPTLAMSINLALEEAITNIVFYAYPEKTKGEVKIDASWDSEKLTFVVTDFGMPFDPTQKEDVDISLSAEERPIGGLGIFLVKKLMDTISYERKDSKNVLTMTKHIKNVSHTI